jgi:long-chain fatty acid transport protein
MKKNRLTRIGTGIALSLVATTMLHATNGDNLIAVGTKARGMGGTGIALGHGAESTLINPALITSVEGTEISFGGTLFMPTIKTGYSGFPGATSYTSGAKTNIIPEVSIAHKINDNWYIGVGMWGTAGMGVDFSKAPLAPFGGNQHMITNLQLLQFAVPVAYTNGDFSVAVAPILQYGNLDINYIDFANNNVGSGLAQDFGFGFNAGATYDFTRSGIEGLTLGAMYKSSIKMNYYGQLSTATQPFVPAIFPAAMADTLEQPAEYGVGLAYESGQHTIAFDYKKIKWSSVKGYKDFGWKDQNVYALGYQYSQDNWQLRTGFNYAKSAVVEMPGGATVPASAAINFFNLVGFPATSEKHYTVGGTYEFTKSVSLDLSYVYSPKSTKTFKIGGLGMPPPAITTEHSENSASFQLTFKF